MELSLQLSVFAVSGTAAIRQLPYALDEARGALDTAFRPFEIALGRAVREHEPAHGIGTIFGEDRLRVDRVALRLGHLFDSPGRHPGAVGDPGPVGAPWAHPVGAEPAAVAGPIGAVSHHSLGEQSVERLGDPDPPKSLECP